MSYTTRLNSSKRLNRATKSCSKTNGVCLPKILRDLTEFST